MIKITEHKSSSGNFFIVDTLENKKKLSSQIIKLKSCILHNEKNNTTYFMLYDVDMKPISEVFNFLNFNLASCSFHTKEKNLHALKLLYSYLTIFNLELSQLTKLDITNLQYFLKGISPCGYTISLELLSNRKNETINGYLSIYRSYIKALNIKNSPLLKKSAKPKSLINPFNDSRVLVDSYESSVRLAPPNKETPKYISVDEFKKIITIIRKYYSIREECIVRLMFEGGLRIGEVLGLTADDIVVEEINGVTTGIVYIRNRYTDKPYQQAKTCMNINSKKQYVTDEYNTLGYGYQTVPIDLELVDLINDYIEESHIWAREAKNDNYYKYSLADRIRETSKYEDDNYYVFINKLGKPLSYQSWKGIIRDIFIKSNIPIDSEKRKNNINHRFRHGFAMYLVKYLNCEPLELSKRMRHKSLSSTEKYYNPTTSDIIEKKNEISNHLYSIIPELTLR
ncbi:site-specific integrase [uncultured Clostridium sp.]|jgi:site-specific recombinase, phage integrase family|uniref:tyrosine-type recombinase/integrase n=1 Tax=uncultured Clostridium sp. TaxID=59620 RepID=UPI0025F0992F|nr:site-specific integrase [uncultured Clostridium sp.]